MRRRLPTEDQMRSAWHAMARPGWGSFEAAQRAAVHWALVQIRASLIGSDIDPDAAPRDASGGTQPGTAPTPGTEPTAAVNPAHWGSLRVPHPLPALDRKRAAAGERADD